MTEHTQNTEKESPVLHTSKDVTSENKRDGETSPLSINTIWEVAQEEFRFHLSRPGYETWLANASLLSCDNGHCFIGVPTRLAQQWLTERYSALIKETLSAILSTDCIVSIVIDPAVGSPPDEPIQVSIGTDFVEEMESSQVTEATGNTQLNLSFDFSSFVVGNSNHFAYAAARAVADSPGRAYNPLFLYGGVGLGKTHLMHAIGNAVQARKGRRLRVAYITCEKFTNETVTAILENKTSEFRKKYRSVDVLLIDDIQFLAGKDRTQEEFFHTFNSLQEIQKQIVISSDRPPKDIPTLEERLRSRFEGGLMADIQPPDFETRLAILNSKLGVHASLVPDDVCSFIAHKIQKNIRELEGALIRVVAHASLENTPVSLTVAQEVLKDIFPPMTTRTVFPEEIVQAVAAYYTVSIEEMKSKKRDKNIVFPRQVAMYIIREETDSSLPVIGSLFGGRDHTTVLHAIEKIKDLSLEDSRLRNDIEKIQQSLYLPS